MKADEDYVAVMASNDPLELKKLIFKTIYSHQDSKSYPYAIVVDNFINILGFQQNLLSDQDYHERSGTKFDVAKAQGVTFECEILLKCEANVNYSKSFEDCTPTEQADIRSTVNAKFQAYVELRNASNKHSKAKDDLHDDYVKEKDPTRRASIYPRSTDETFKVLKEHTKASRTVQKPVSKGGSFAQKGGQRPKGRNQQQNEPKEFNKDHWKNKFCQSCGAKGHPHWANICKPTNNQDDSKSVSSKRSTKSKQEFEHKFLEKQTSIARLLSI